MRNLFPGYYKPTEDEFQELWQEGIFCFDTNILLNVYRYSSKTRERLFEILNKLQDRIWIPYQVAYEYQQERINVISYQSKTYEKIPEKLDEDFANLKKELTSYNKRHSFSDFIEIEQIIKTIDRAYTEVKNILKNAKSQYPDLINDDEYKETLTELFDESRIGKPYSNKELADIYKQADSRYTKKQPPGYKDTKKDNQEKYGDVLIWFELIAHAKSVKKPLIFITDDKKEDWWLIHQGNTIGPRPELIQEMFSEAKVKFYMYTGASFLKYAEEFLQLSKQPETIEEAEEIRLEEEKQNQISTIINNDITRIPKKAWIEDLNQTVLEAVLLLAKDSNSSLDSSIQNILNPIPPILRSDYTKLIAELTKKIEHEKLPTGKDTDIFS